jgi:Fur family transcriptional regulator, zinc uptake regulator
MTSLKRDTQAAYLLDVLRASPRPLGAYELLERARANGIVSPIIVYRALERLLESGAIYRVPSLKAFAPIREEARGVKFSKIHQICFAVCEGCGMTKELEYPITSWNFPASEFAPRIVTVEVRGLCSGCQQQSTARKAAFHVGPGRSTSR